jgi:dihydroorotate dehydrogenase (NAD+) catalytic subunit
VRRRRAPSGPVDLSVGLASAILPNPIVAASGTYGHGAELAAVCPPDRLGAVTVKSLAPFAWEGNPALRATGAAGGGMLNSVGLAGPGVERWKDDDLPALRASGARVIASLWGREVDDYAKGAAALADVADQLIALELNLSCPNVHHVMFAQSEMLTREIVRTVRDSYTGGPVFAKLTAGVTDIVAIARAAIDAGANGLTLINTLPAFAIDVATRRPVLGAGNGGLSGPPLKHVALRAVHDVAIAMPGIPIIGTGGVTTGVDAVELLLAGASAVGVGTATFREPRAMLRIITELEQWCATNRTTPTELITNR